MSFDPDGWTFGGIMGAVTALIGTIGVQQRRQVGGLQDELKSERKDCREAIKELRDQQRETMGIVIELAERIGQTEVASRARSISPPRAFAAVNPDAEPDLPRPTGKGKVPPIPPPA